MKNHTHIQSATSIEIQDKFSIIYQEIIKIAIASIQTGKGIKYENIDGNKAAVLTILNSEIIKNLGNQFEQNTINEQVAKFADTIAIVATEDENGNPIHQRIHLFRGLDIKAEKESLSFTFIIDDYFKPGKLLDILEEKIHHNTL